MSGLQQEFPCKSFQLCNKSHWRIFLIFILHRNTFKTEQRWTHLIVSSTLGLRDELGIADVTIAFCEQASIHDACRLHLHLRLNRQIWMSFDSEGSGLTVNLSVWVNGVCKLNLEIGLLPHPEWQIWDDSSAQNMLILSVRTSSHGVFWMQSWMALGSHFNFCILP